jgi:hypothetical protein
MKKEINIVSETELSKGGIPRLIKENESIGGKGATYSDRGENFSFVELKNSYFHFAIRMFDDDVGND